MKSAAENRPSDEKKEHIETTQDDTIIFLRAKESLAGLVAVVTAWARMRKQFISLVDG